MSSLDKIIKLATKFETKLIKNAAEEVDSTILTLIFRPKIKQILTAFDPKLAKAVTAIGSGNLIVGKHVFTTASLVAGKWAVSTVAAQVEGSLADEPTIAPIVQSINAALKNAFTAELNRMHGSLQGDIITNQDTWTPEVREYAF